MTNVKPTIISLVAVVLCGLAAVANATPLVDGKFDPSEGYTDSFMVKFDVEAGKKRTVAADDGRLWLYQDFDNNLYVSLTLPLTLVDNTYGRNSVGWGKNVAISGKKHSFKHLQGGDNAQFEIYDGQGYLVLDFTMDYISPEKKAPSGFATGGVDKHRGKVAVGSADDILEVGTSLDYNFNTLGHKLDKNSPKTDDNYTEDAKHAGWLFEVSYEFKIDGKVFGENGLGGIQVPQMEVSPNKIAKNKVFGQVTNAAAGAVPEPASLALLGLGAVGLLPNWRR